VAMGAQTLVVTSVERDGALVGADDALLAHMRQALPTVRLIGGGGVASLDDALRLARLGLDGVVLGRALYERRISLPDAVVALAQLEEGG
jgi:phosphoribosylformimino-5-aminoimidazole carboxamide ribonucleotide (ProFAR) isomerase